MRRVRSTYLCLEFRGIAGKFAWYHTIVEVGEVAVTIGGRVGSATEVLVFSIGSSFVLRRK